MFSLDEENKIDSYDVIKSVSGGEVYIKRIDKVTVNSWNGLQNAINNSDNEMKIVLGSNISSRENQNRIEIVDSKRIILNLNGKELRAMRSGKIDDGHVIEVHNGGVLTVTDSIGGCCITGGWATEGGGVIIDNGGSFTFESGKISGNKAEDGGGIYVCDNATFTMAGGTVTENNASNEGGGVIVSTNNSKFNMYGGVITGNNAMVNAGGVFVAADGAVTMSGNPTITGNVKNGTYDADSDVYVKGDGGSDNNVYLKNNAVITVAGALKNETPIGVTMYQTGVFTCSPYETKAKDYAGKFASDDKTYTVTTENDELKLALPTYTVTWKNGDDILKVDDVESGALPSYDDETPTKEGFIFAGWKDGNNTYGLNDALPEVTADVTYTAVFNIIVPLGYANCDGKLDVLDVTAIQRHAAEFEFLTGAALLAADVDCNGVVDVRDATLLQMYLAEFDVTLGVQA